MWLHTSCTLSFDILAPAPFVLMLRPRSGAQQWIAREEYRLIPSVPVSEYTDGYGNLCQRLIAPAGNFEVHTSADVMTADFVDSGWGSPFVEIQNLPDSVLSYLLPSRYCESERFHDMASEISVGRELGYAQVHQIVCWLRDNVEYKPGSGELPLSATEVNSRKVGVCRDLAHLGIALCRSLSIPARMVVGYLYGLRPMDQHAWFEAYVGGRWYTFDATQDELRGGYVAVGYGRDAADVAIFNQFGPPGLPAGSGCARRSHAGLTHQLVSWRLACGRVIKRCAKEIRICTSTSGIAPIIAIPNRYYSVRRTSASILATMAPNV